MSMLLTSTRLPQTVAHILVSLAALAASAPLATANDLDTIRSRIMAPLLVAPPDTSVHKLIASQQPDGSWSDINYADRSRSTWSPPTHLSRLKVLAQAHRTMSAGASSDEETHEVLAAVNKGLDHWLRTDPQNPNWWWNKIGVPKSLLPVLLLVDNKLTPAQRAGGLKILGRAKIGMTGQNLVWVTEITAGRGLLEHDTELVTKAYKRIAEEIRQSTGEGIQPDYSFHQHGPCLYSHGYGAGFIADCSRIAAQVDGTTMAFPREKIELLAHLILDGTQWMTRGGATDFGAEGREITRKGQSTSHLAAAARNMLQLSTGREQEFRTLAARVAGQSQAPPLVGNRHFWRADFMAHHRSGYYASARMHSKRIASTDGPANSEGLLSHHLADGCFVLMQNGREYFDIFGVWDWQRIPGTTIEFRPQLTGTPRRMGTTDFVGGVSDGNIGLAACDFARGKLTAQKAWFFFDREIVCLGAGIRCDSELPVITTINQCFLRGEVKHARDGHQQTLETGQHASQPMDLLWHDSVAYVMLEPTQLSVNNTIRSGSWHDSNRRHADRQETRDLFTAWIDHGTQPQEAHYAYAVVPAMEADAVAPYLADPDYRVLSNTQQLQAVAHEQLGLVAAAFYQPGKLPVGTELVISVDQPCLLLAQRIDGRIALTLSNPRNAAATIRVKLVSPSDASQDRLVEVSLPGGPLAGSSVTIR